MLLTTYSTNDGSDFTDCLVNCSNNGNCIVSADKQLTCECNEHFTESDCSRDMRLCSKRLCSNNGTCIDKINATEIEYNFECQCPDNFVGRNCQIRIDLCLNETCSLNGK